MDAWLRRVDVIAGLAFTAFLAYTLARRTGAVGHGTCNKTDGYCFTHNKALG